MALIGTLLKKTGATTQMHENASLNVQVDMNGMKVLAIM